MPRTGAARGKTPCVSWGFATSVAGLGRLPWQDASIVQKHILTAPFSDERGLTLSQLVSASSLSAHLATSNSTAAHGPESPYLNLVFRQVVSPCTQTIPVRRSSDTMASLRCPRLPPLAARSAWVLRLFAKLTDTEHRRSCTLLPRRSVWSLWAAISELYSSSGCHSAPPR